jgi:hypothetical protein
MRAVLAGALAALLMTACPGAAESPKRPLPSYAGRAVELFDDAIESKAVGLDLEQSTPARADPLLRERTQVADAVLRARIDTVTAKQEDSGTTYTVTLHTAEKLTGSYPPASPFSVKVDRTDKAAGILRSFEARLVGMQFVIFVREFVRPDGDSELHFHMAPDSKEVLAAINEAMTLAELKK